MSGVKRKEGGGAEKGGKRGKYKHYSKKPGQGAVPLGVAGFVITCQAGNEARGAREILNLLNEAWEEAAPGSKPVKASVEEGGHEEVAHDSKEDRSESEADEGETAVQKTGDVSNGIGDESKPGAPGNIEEELEAEMAGLRDTKQAQFSSMETGCKGVLFVRMARHNTGPGPSELALQICQAAADTKKSKTRTCMRILPAEITCYASPETIAKAATPILERSFPVGAEKAIKFAVVYDSRANDSIDRMEVINALAGAVPEPHKVDLSEPDKTIIVQIIKTVCTVGVVDKFKELYKYNVQSIVNPPPKEANKKTST